MVKILLCGGVQGQWASLFERVRKLNASAKGLPFELLVCVGRVLPFPPEYLSGERQVPISTYLLPADEQSNEEQAGEQQQQQLIAKIKTAKAEESPLEIAPNCFCLAGHGVTTVSSSRDCQVHFSVVIEFPAAVMCDACADRRTVSCLSIRHKGCGEWSICWPFPVL